MKLKQIIGPLNTALKEGDPYVDEPVLKVVPVYCGKEPMRGKVLDHYKRTPLRWLKPDGNGGWVPRG